MDAWLGGATVLDPTCGRGDLLFGLMSAALAPGIVNEFAAESACSVSSASRHFFAQLVDECRREFGVEFPPENLHASRLPARSAAIPGRRS